MDCLRIDNIVKNFTRVEDLVTNLNQVTYDLIGREEIDYFDVTKIENVEDAYVISFFDECVLVKMILANKSNFESVLNQGIESVWGKKVLEVCEND